MTVLVIKRGIPLRLRLQLVKEITDELAERQLILKVDNFSIAHELLTFAVASAILTKFLDFFREFSRSDDSGRYHGLFPILDQFGLGGLHRVVDSHQESILRAQMLLLSALNRGLFFTIRCVSFLNLRIDGSDKVADAWLRDNGTDRMLIFESLPEHVHVKHTKESTSEPTAERSTRFERHFDATISKTKFGQCLF